MISALVSAGIEAGYLANPRLAKVHWQAAGRPLPAPRAGVAGESALWVDPAEIPSDADISTLGGALAAGRHGERDELMASTAAYSGLRWGELAALTVAARPDARVITVDRKVIEVAGHLYMEAPKNRKLRRTIYPRCTPGGYPLADRLTARIEGPRRAAGRSQPARPDLPLADGQALAVLQLPPQRPQARLPGGRVARPGRQRQWTWHSLRHVFCTTALFTWKLDATDVSRMAGHANFRTTLDMYVGTTAGILGRARTATE